MKKHKIYFKVFSLILFMGALALIFGFNKLSSALAVGNPPTLNLPYPSGTTGVSMGVSGLHAGNFSAVPGTPYTLSGYNSISDASLDMGFVNQSSTSVHAVALASGTVLIGYGNGCNMVLIDYGNAGNGSHLWGEYIHMGNIPSNVTAGSTVTAGQVVGTPTTNYVCGESGTSNFVHTHFAFLYGNGTSGTYQSMTSTSLCGHTVLSNSSAPNHGGTIDNLQGLTSAFTVPSCSSGLPVVSSGINVSSNITMNAPFTSSFTVTNPNNSNFYIDGLGIFAQDVNGNNFLIQQENNNGQVYIGANATRSFTGNVQNFGYNCPACTDGGRFNIIAEYQDTSGNWYTMGYTNGANNVAGVSVNPALPEVTSGINVSSNITMNAPFTSSFTVTNPGNSGYTINRLGIFAQDVNGNNFLIQQEENGGQVTIPANGTRSFTGGVQNFGYNCPACTDGGRFNIIAEYQDTSGNWYTMGYTSGANNVAGVSVNPALPEVTSGINVSSNITMNAPFTSSFTVTNPGNSGFNILRLGIFAQDVNGNNFLIQQEENGGQVTIPANGTRSFTGSVQNFAYNCPQCTNGGRYNIIAEYQDTSGNWYTMGYINGANNVAGVSVNPKP